MLTSRRKSSTRRPPGTSTLSEGTDLFGRAFEHFLLNEIRAFLSYRGQYRSLAFWRTSSGYEVDLIVGDLELAIEFKSSKRVREEDLRGMRALLSEQRAKRAIVVSREEAPRMTGDRIEIFPWRMFCAQLWGGQLL